MIYRFEDYELDTTLFELRRAGESLHLEPQVFSVLAHLVEHRDRVVSKIELLDEVWLDRFVSESALTSRIQAARRACGDSGREQRVIQTRHGRGYRFVAEVAVESTHPDNGTDTPASVVGGTTARPAGEPSLSGATVVGREQEIAMIEHGLAELASGRGIGAFVGGVAGSGKTTVVEEALERSAGSFDLLRARCRPHSGLPEPYVSLLEALGRFGRESGTEVAETIGRVSPTWLTQLPSLVDPEHIADLEVRALGGTHHRMLREGVDLFGALAVRRPLVLVIEDVHWADDGTLEVVEWLIGRTFDASLTIVCTYRVDEEGSDRVEHLIERLASNERVSRATLGPLEPRDLRAVACNRLDAATIEDELVRILAAHSGGNPLFAGEELDLWRSNGSVGIIDDHIGVACEISTLESEVPESVRRLIEERVERLSEGDRELLEVASIVGRDAPAFAIAAGVGSPLEEVERDLVRLARQDELVDAIGDEVWPDGTVSTSYRIGHELHRQTLYEAIPTSRRARVHQRVGERLERAYGHRVDEHVAVLARHFLSAGDADRAVRYLHRAGDQALAMSAHSDAVESYRLALDRLPNVPASAPRDALELSIRASLGTALVATLGWGSPMIDENYRRAMAVCNSDDAPRERFVVRYGLASVHELRGEYNRSEELLREQLADGTDLGVEAKELLACSTFHQGAFETSLDFAQAGLDAWDQVAHSSYMARYGEHPGVSCSTWGALSAWHLGEPELAARMANEAIEWAASNQYALSTAYIQSAFLAQHRGDVRGCRSWAERTVAIAEVHGFTFRAGQADVLIAWCSVVIGEAEPGALEEAFTGYRTFGARMDEPYYLGLVADVDIRAGDLDAARRHLAEAEEVIAETTRSFFYEPELARLGAVAAAVDRDAVERDGLLVRATDLAEQQNSVPLILRTAVTRARLGDVGEAALGSLGVAVSRYETGDDFPDLAEAREILATAR
jgi:DNA-binding winged helix-turn-helix (wHTH) protein/tetratricopeptide (TPR) repeat protein